MVVEKTLPSAKLRRPRSAEVDPVSQQNQACELAACNKES
jgi:hypothetical protein